MCWCGRDVRGRRGSVGRAWHARAPSWFSTRSATGASPPPAPSHPSRGRPPRPPSPAAPKKRPRAPASKPDSAPGLSPSPRMRALDDGARGLRNAKRHAGLPGKRVVMKKLTCRDRLGRTKACGGESRQAYPAWPQLCIICVRVCLCLCVCGVGPGGGRPARRRPGYPVLSFSLAVRKRLSASSISRAWRTAPGRRRSPGGACRPSCSARAGLAGGSSVARARPGWPRARARRGRSRRPRAQGARELLLRKGRCVLPPPEAETARRHRPRPLRSPSCSDGERHRRRELDDATPPADLGRPPCRALRERRSHRGPAAMQQRGGRPAASAARRSHPRRSGPSHRARRCHGSSSSSSP